RSGAAVPGTPPWDPRSGAVAPPLPQPVRGRGNGRSLAPSAATVEARALQASAFRRIWSTLLDRRDWTSYVYVPLLVPIVVLLPYLVVKYYEQSQRMGQLVRSLSQGTRDFQVMSRLLESQPEPWAGVPAEEVKSLTDPNLKGFEILQDSRILDLRNWKPAQLETNDAGSIVNGYRRLKVLKQPETGGNNTLCVDVLATSPRTAVR